MLPTAPQQRLPALHAPTISSPAHCASCPTILPPCRFIVENYNLRYLLTEVPEKDRLHPVALPAFPSTAPTGHVRRQVRGCLCLYSLQDLCGVGVLSNNRRQA